MNRREVLQLIALGLLDAGLNNLWGCTTKVRRSAEKKGKVVHCLTSADQKTTTLRILNWDSYEHEDFLIPLAMPHCFIRDRNDPNSVFLFEIFGSCVRMNLATKELVKIDHTEARELFCGHAIQANSGEFLLSTQLSADFKDSIVSFRDAKTLRKIGVAPKECGQAHQVVKLPNTNLAAFGNCTTLDGKPGGGITFYDYEKRQLVQRINFPYPVVHLIPISSSEIIGISYIAKQYSENKPPELSYQRTSMENLVTYSGGADLHSGPRPLYYAKLDGTHRVIWDEARKDLFRYGLGISGIPKSHSFLSSYTATNSVILWRDFRIAKVFSVPTPSLMVVSADASEFMVTSGTELKVFSLETFAELRTIRDSRPVAMLSAY